jgi:hypothetical protein
LVGLGADAVQLVQVDGVDAEAGEATVALFDDVLGGEELRALEGGCQGALRGHDVAVARDISEGAAEQLFALAVASGGVEEVDAHVEGAVDEGVLLLEGSAAALTKAAGAAGAEADERYIEACAAELSILHEVSFSRTEVCGR